MINLEHNNPGRRFLPAVLGVFIACGLFATPARAQVTVVTNCTELAFTNALAAGGIVTFTQDCSGITLTAPIIISTDTTIDTGGHSVHINGNQLLVFTVTNAAHFTNIGLTITGGRGTNGGALCINSNATVLLTNCTFSGNNAVGPDGTNGAAGANTANNGGNGGNGVSGVQALGGAIYNLGTLTALRCQFVTNNATGGNGGSGGNGGNGVFSGGNGGSGGNGAAASGGAIYHSGASLFLKDCTFSGNTVTGGNGGAGGSGGNTGTNGSGPFPGRQGTGGTGATASGAGVFFGTTNVTVLNCTFSGNTAGGGDSAAAGTMSNGNGANGANGGDGLGGGICALTGGGSLVNCTFSQNTVTGGNGGDGGPSDAGGGDGGNGGNGIGGGFFSSSASSTNLVINCTFNNDGASGGTNGLGGDAPFPGSDGDPGSNGGGNIANVGSSNALLLANSIFATNLTGQGYSGPGWLDAGYNVTFDTSLHSSGTNLLLTNYFGLGPLADNGGPTKTMALLTDSPARDRIPLNVVFPSTDQRGVTRPQGTKADSGAYELVTKPAIITQPASQTQTNGGTATFTVSAVGDSLSYLWRLRGTNVYYGTSTFSSPNTNFPASASPNLQLLSVSVTNSGSYDVVVTNSFGSVTSSPAVLSVVPYIVTQPTNKEVGAGQNAIFSVTAAADQPLSYTWLLNQTNPIAGATGPNYTTNADVGGDGSTYRVIVSNSLGVVTSAVATLTVDAVPSVTVDPTNQAVAVSNDFTFHAQALGTQPLSYQWRTNGVNLLGATSPDVSLNARPYHAGLWDVVVTNRFGSVTSAPATLTVLSPPTITSQPANQVVKQGQNASFTVSATGDGPLFCQWRLSGTNLAGAPNGMTLSLTNIQPAMGGAYSVLVTNSVGSAVSSNAVLTVLVPPLVLQPRLISSNFTFVFQSQVGATYVTEQKTNLSGGAWSPAATNTGTGGTLTNAFPRTNGPSRFYRIRLL